MNEVTHALPWARAYTELAREKGVEGKKECEKLMATIESCENLKVLLFSGLFNPGEQEQVLGILGPKIPLKKVSIHFFSLLLRSKRASLIPSIVLEVGRLEDSARGLVRGALSGPGPKGEPWVMEEMKKFLEKRLQKKVELIYKQETTLSAGHRARVGHFVVDASLEGQLERFKSLTQRGN